jgi:tRNA A-37 threonylcarbamoyl transferase component Bud32
MRTLPVLSELSDDFSACEEPGAVLVQRKDCAAALARVGFGLRSNGALRQSELVGRRPLFELSAGDETFVVRRFSHGGLMRWLTGSRFLDPQRPFRELLLSEALLAAGIATPQVVAARALRSRPFGWRLELMTRRLPDTIDLGFVHALIQRGELSRSDRVRLLEATGALIRSLHELGFRHADLCPNNILVSRAAIQGGPLELWILDLDRSEFVPELDDTGRRDNLRRLYRHVARREDMRGSSLTRADFARFLRGYDPDRRGWKADWRAIAARHSSGTLSHRLGWWLEQLFGSGHDPRTASFFGRGPRRVSGDR